jgi:hypothetical protein
MLGISRSRRVPRSINQHGVRMIYACSTHRGMRVQAVSIRSHRGVQGVQQIRIVEWLEQACDRPFLQQAGANSLVPFCSDKDDWNFLSSELQFALKIGPRHARHGDIQKETTGLTQLAGRKKLFCRRESLSREAEDGQQIRQRLAYGFVVIDHGNKRAFVIHGFLRSFSASVKADVCFALQSPTPIAPLITVRAAHVDCARRCVRTSSN